jgi:hypothetical protein
MGNVQTVPEPILSDEAAYACGVAYPISQKEERLQRLAATGYDISQAASYADVVCRSLCGDPQFLRSQFGNRLDTTYTFEALQKERATLNLTSLGNMAYYALHATPPYNETARVVYWRLIEIFSGGTVKHDTN